MEVVALELVPILRGTFGSDILQGDTGQLRYSIPKQSRSWLRGVGRADLRLWTMRCTVQDCMSNGPWVKHSGMDPRPMASVSLGPGFEQRGWNHGPHCRVEVRGPSGPGDPCAVQFLIKDRRKGGSFMYKSLRPSHQRSPWKPHHRELNERVKVITKKKR